MKIMSSKSLMKWNIFFRGDSGIVKETLVQLFVSILSRLVSMLNSIYAVSVLGPYNIGFTGIIQSSISQASIFYDGGLNAVGIRSLVESGRSDLEIAMKIVSFRFLISFALALLWFLSVLVFEPKNQLVWMIGSFYIIINALDLNFVYRSLGNFNVYALIMSLGPVLVAGLYRSYLFNSYQVGFDLYFLFVGSALTCILAWLYVYFKLKIKLLRFFHFREYFNLFKMNKSMWFTSIIGIVYPAIQVYSIALLLGLTENGIFKASFIFLVPIELLSTTLAGVILPKLSEWRANGAKFYNDRVTTLGRLFFILFFFVFFLIFLIPSNVLQDLVGIDYLFSFDVFRIVLIGKIVMIVLLPFSVALVANKQDSLNLKISIGVLLISFFFNFTLIPEFGLKGAAVAMMICDMAFPVVALFKFYKS